MSKVTLDIEDFKTLASEARLDILRAIDQRSMSLKDISKMTKLHETTVHEHITKLVRSGFVKKNEREGHKWVYYKLSWKGSSLLHPDNTKVVVMLTTTFVLLLGGIMSVLSLLNIINLFNGGVSDHPVETVPGGVPHDGFSAGGGWSLGAPVAFICLLLFCVFILYSIQMYRNNKPPRL